MPSSTAPAKPRVLKAGDVRVAPVVHLAGDATAHARAEDERRREIDEAYRAGLADGRRRAEEEGITAAARVEVELASATDLLRTVAAQQVAADAAAIAGTALEIARWILTREVSADTTAVIGRIEAAMAELTHAADVEIHVPPAHVGAVKAWATGVDVVADPSLAAGEARVTAGAATAELTFAEAFRRAAAALGLSEDGAEERADG